MTTWYIWRTTQLQAPMELLGGKHYCSGGGGRVCVSACVWKASKVQLEF